MKTDFLLSPPLSLCPFRKRECPPLSELDALYDKMDHVTLTDVLNGECERCSGTMHLMREGGDCTTPKSKDTVISPKDKNNYASTTPKKMKITGTTPKNIDLWDLRRHRFLAQKPFLDFKLGQHTSGPMGSMGRGFHLLPFTRFSESVLY